MLPTIQIKFSRKSSQDHNRFDRRMIEHQSISARAYLSMYWGSVAAIAVLAVAGLCDNASAAEWKVAKLSGSVFIKSGPMRGIALTSGMILRDGLELIADKSGRALLIHGSDQMIVSPTSTAA